MELNTCSGDAALGKQCSCHTNKTPEANQVGCLSACNTSLSTETQWQVSWQSRQDCHSEGPNAARAPHPAVTIWNCSVRLRLWNSTAGPQKSWGSQPPPSTCWTLWLHTHTHRDTTNS